MNVRVEVPRVGVRTISVGQYGKREEFSASAGYEPPAYKQRANRGFCRVCDKQFRGMNAFKHAKTHRYQTGHTVLIYCLTAIQLGETPPRTAASTPEREGG